MNYTHRQTAMFSTRLYFGVPMVLCLILTVWLLIAGGGLVEAIGPLIAVVILLVMDMLFRSLTVTIDTETISLAFGLGIIQKQFRIAEIESAGIIRNRWWYGLGIRKIRHGWLYNVSGLDAVELQMKDGPRYRIGTDEPNKLLEAIESARHKE